jgi:hypothetical protein
MKQSPLWIEITLREGMDERWEAWFEGLAITTLAAGGTRLSGQVRDRAALHGCLERIRDLNLKLVSVTVEEK